MSGKKPDSVVFNPETQRYDAFLRPYATERSAPRIVPEETNSWKRRGARSVNERLAAEFEELKARYEALRERLEYNQLIYNARFQFEPVVGRVYHLYKNSGEHPFLSVIAPHECRFEHLGSFRLQSDLSWSRLNEGDQASPAIRPE